MTFLDKLERVFGRFAIPNLSLYLVIVQVFVLLTSMLGMIDPDKLFYAPVLVLRGEWWRIFTFLAMPPFPSMQIGFIFLAFFWYLFYLMGNALEHHWGTFRFNVFIFASYFLTVVTSFLAPIAAVENTYILGSVLLAFAFLNPNFELLLFFILPLKIKWIALITWIGYAYKFIVGGLPLRLQIGSAVAIYLLFFGGEMLRGSRQRVRVRERRAEREAEAAEPRHVCHVCGKTDLSHPQLDFRYCSKCAGDQCYCPEHIQNHAHVVAADDAKAP